MSPTHFSDFFKIPDSGDSGDSDAETPARSGPLPASSAEPPTQTAPPNAPLAFSASIERAIHPDTGIPWTSDSNIPHHPVVKYEVIPGDSW